MLDIVEKTLKKKGELVNFSGLVWWMSFMKATSLAFIMINQSTFQSSQKCHTEGMKHYFSSLKKPWLIMI